MDGEPKFRASLEWHSKWQSQTLIPGYFYFKSLLYPMIPLESHSWRRQETEKSWRGKKVLTRRQRVQTIDSPCTQELMERQWIGLKDRSFQIFFFNWRKQRHVLEETEKYKEWLRGKWGWYRCEFQGRSLQHEIGGAIVPLLKRLKELGAEKRAQYTITSGFLVTFKQEIPISLANISARW